MGGKIIQVTTYPFGTCNSHTCRVLEDTEFEVRYNPYGRRLKPDEVGELVQDAHGIVAGTEPYSVEIIRSCKNLEVISRVGVGLDNVDLQACQKKSVTVTYTPQAPVQGVADLTVAQIINLLRGTYISHQSIRNGLWDRIIGKLVSEVKIGVLGVGRIGKQVCARLFVFGAELYGCDLVADIEFGKEYNIRWVDKDTLFSICDLVTIHIPLSKDNYHFVGFEEMSRMQTGAFLVNTSRGPIIDEASLVSLLQNRHLGGVALDVFEKEPYEGPLTDFDNVLFTAHIGASASYCRYQMELQAAEDCVRVLSGRVPANPVREEVVG